MNNWKKYTACFAFLAVLFITSCEWEYEPRVYQAFNIDLRGTWVSNDPSVYSGKLIIDYDRITVTGFSEGQTPPREDDNKRPFKGFTKGASLKGYSEEGKIFIEDGGFLREGIPFNLYSAGSYSQEKFLSFNFGGRSETLQKQ